MTSLVVLRSGASQAGIRLLRLRREPVNPSRRALCKPPASIWVLVWSRACSVTQRSSAKIRPGLPHERNQHIAGTAQQHLFANGQAHVVDTGQLGRPIFNTAMRLLFCRPREKPRGTQKLAGTRAHLGSTAVIAPKCGSDGRPDRTDPISSQLAAAQ